MRLLLTILFVLLANMAPAQTHSLPALFDVRGVASDDVLNVRSGPGVENEIIGALKHDARGIEAVGANADGTWLLVNTFERAGWASARFLQRTGPDWDAGLPRPLGCFGTEPFWSLTHGATGASWSDFDVSDQPLSERWSGRGSGVGAASLLHGWVLDGPGGTLNAVIEAGLCSDGMSDRAYGLGIRLIRQGPDGPALYAGCCALAP